MENINIKINGIDTLVKIQRYFTNENSAYLVYSNDDADTDGNVKIYVAKIIDNNQVVAINMPEEWDKVKKSIVGIINDNKECSKLEITDLDYSILNNIEITEAKALRLPSAVMQYLSANSPKFNDVSLTENKIELGDNSEKLKNMTAELDAMIAHFENQTTGIAKEEKVEPVLEVEPQLTEPVTIDTNGEEIKSEEKMSATMEIIMPTKQNIVEEDPKKKKKFSFKTLFGKKEDDDEVKDVVIDKDPAVIENKEVIIEQEPITILEKQVEVTPSAAASEPTTLSNESIGDITMEAELPTPIELNPIVVENAVEEGPTSLPPFENIVIQTLDEEPIKENKEPDVSGFDFFNTEATTNVTSKGETPMEVLMLEEDAKYKKMYEETSEKVTELENRIFEMEKSIEIYEAKIKEIKNIAQ